MALQNNSHIHGINHIIQTPLDHLQNFNELDINPVLFSDEYRRQHHRWNYDNRAAGISTTVCLLRLPAKTFITR